MILQSDISKGSTNQLADCLYRLGCQKDKNQLPKLKIHAITRQLPATAYRLNQFHTETPKMKNWHYLNILFKLDGLKRYVTFQKKSNCTGPSMKR